jgi:SAM-dependent methyltransferase
MDIAFLNQIRKRELAVADAQLSQPPGRLLEIGAGTGAQAAVLAARGFDVQAIEIAGSVYENDQVFPVSVYDGKVLPFPNASFDIVFTSHMLVHIEDEDAFQQEILRVLKPGGRVVHILPTSSWRFWTNLVHYPASYVRHGLRIMRTLLGAAPAQGSLGMAMAAAGAGAAAPGQAGGPSVLARLFTPPARVSARGNALTEQFDFSEHNWKKLFSRNGQVVEACLPNRLFYTGHMSLGPRLPMQVRQALSYLLGSGGKVYVLRAKR